MGVRFPPGALETKLGDGRASPAIHYCFIVYGRARLAQLVRASRLHREGRGFESLSAHMKRVHCIVTGKVQRVGFRDFVHTKARGLGLAGSVENTPSGAVEVYAQGEEDHLERLITHLHKGPFNAKVLAVQVEWVEPEEGLSGFDIIY